jgi:NTE family protein
MSLAQAPHEETRPPELGLALSGGGFRASFFHVGVLARLAETGTLRKVEVISTVSGGSILGALYYLALKDLLENVPDAEITDEHYVQVVRRVEKTLFKGVARQVRALAYADLGKNLRMRHANYSRSDRIGELYDEIFYRPTWNESQFGGAPAPRLNNGPIQMRELLIHPPGEPDNFKPLHDNGRRRAPVPVLLLNATSLNTGHNWRFQAVEMGEAPRSREDWVQIDKNMRLLSGRYEQIVESQQDFPLGHAVAASACVPALFHPLALSGLFPGVRVELVDGGVHDNQGVGGLLDLDCVRMIVSDASGQMGDIPDPSTRIPAAAGRSSSIYGDRVREEQLIESMVRPGTVLMHLRKGLPVRGISPLGVDGKPLAQTSELGTIDYQVAPEVQDRLARLRTDLDSFSEVEAYSLSLYAYLMTCGELPEAPQLTYEWDLDASEVASLRAELQDPGDAYRRQLEVAAKRFRKAAALNGKMRALELAAALLALVVLAGIAWLLRDAVTEDLPAWSLIIALVAPALLVGLYLKPKFRLRAFYVLADWLYTWLVPTVAAPFLWLGTKVTLWASPKFLAEGRIAKLATKDAAVKTR